MARPQTKPYSERPWWQMTVVLCLFTAVFLPAPQLLIRCEAVMSECPAKEDGDRCCQEEVVTCLTVRRRMVRPEWAEVFLVRQDVCCRTVCRPFRLRAVTGHMLLDSVRAPLVI